MKINQTINDALIQLGVIDATENPTSEDSGFALRTLNRILDGYNTQNLTMPHIKVIVYSNTEWDSTQIEIGEGKKIDATPPQSIQQLSFIDQTVDQVTYLCTPMTQTEYEGIRYKGVVGIPTKYFYHQTEAGVKTIYLNRIPQYGLKLSIYAKESYSTNLKITDDIEWGTGVEKMLMLRLTVELSSSYHIPPSQILLATAAEAENTVKANNYSPKSIRLSPSLSGRKRMNYNPARI